MARTNKGFFDTLKETFQFLVTISASLDYYRIAPFGDPKKDRIAIPYFYQVHQGTSYRAVDDKITILPFANFCKAVKLI